jgi:hypothetical protein
LVQYPRLDQPLSLPSEKPRVNHVPCSRDRPGPDRSLGLGSPRGRYPHTRSPLRVWPKVLQSPLLMKDVS